MPSKQLTNREYFQAGFFMLCISKKLIKKAADKKGLTVENFRFLLAIQVINSIYDYCTAKELTALLSEHNSINLIASYKHLTTLHARSLIECQHLTKSNKIGARTVLKLSLSAKYYLTEFRREMSTSTQKYTNLIKRYNVE